MFWTEDMKEVCRKLWADGLSASQIAGEMGGGLTRNAVIGAVHRMNLSGRAKPASPRARTYKPREPKARFVHQNFETFAIKEVLPPPDCLKLSITQLNAETCRWPIGDVGSPDFSYCGVKPGKGVYCPYHSRVAYQPVNERRRLKRLQSEKYFSRNGAK